MLRAANQITRPSMSLKRINAFSVFASRQQSDAGVQPLMSEQYEEAKNRQPPPRRRPSKWKYFAAAVVGGSIGLCGLTYVSEDARLWMVDLIPSSKYTFDKLGLSTTTASLGAAPHTVSDEESKLPLINNKNQSQEDSSLPGNTSQSTSAGSSQTTQSTSAEKSLNEPQSVGAAKKQEREARIAEEKLSVERQKADKQRVNRELEEKLEVELSRAVGLAKEAVLANTDAVEASRAHADMLRQAMDCDKDAEASKLWLEVRELNKKRVSSVKVAGESSQKVEESLSNFSRLLEEAKSNKDTKSNPNISKYKKQSELLVFDIKSSTAELKKAETLSEIMKKYYQQFKNDKENFKKEIQSIVPEVNVGVKGTKLTEEELNSLLAHAHTRIYQLKRQLLEQNLLEQTRLQEAITEQMNADQKDADELVQRELNRQKAELDEQMDQMIRKQAEADREELRRELMRQAGAHQDHLQDMLTLQAQKLVKQFNVSMRERLIDERHTYMDAIMEHVAKLKGIELALEERADLERTITHAQDLIKSSSTLMDVLQQKDPVGSREYMLTNLADSIAACHQLADTEVFYRAVLAGIPGVVSERGVYTESSLEKRFDVVFNQCKRVVLLPQYWYLSYLASLVTFWGAPPRYDNEAEFASLNDMTGRELLIQANYFLKNGCLAAAVRCMDELKGIPRNLAQDWIEEAKLLLTVQQAAQALHTHALSKSLGIIF